MQNDQATAFNDLNFGLNLAKESKDESFLSISFRETKFCLYLFINISSNAGLMLRKRMVPLRDPQSGSGWGWAYFGETSGPIESLLFIVIVWLWIKDRFVSSKGLSNMGLCFVFGGL